MKTLLRLSLLIAASVAFSVSARASDWTGGDGNWSSNANPGWNGTGIPNAVGAVANFSDATAIGQHFTHNVDIPATVGSINFNANGDFSRSVITVNSLTMNNGGSGAVISNSNPSTGTNNFLNISSGQNANLVLADDLLVINTSGSTAPADAILIGNLIEGTGNVTFSTVGNTVTDQQTAPGCIRIIQNGSYVGNVLVQKGAVMTSAFSFGDPGNMVTLGQAGQGSVTMMLTTLGGMLNPFTVAAGTGGTTVTGSLNSQGSIFSGDIALNGNLTVNSWVTQLVNPGAFVLQGTISGPGGLTFTTTTTGDPTKVISELDTFDSVTGDPNTYTGGTIVNAGTLIAKGSKALGTGNVSLTAPNVQLTLTSNGTNKIDDNATLSLFDNTDKLNLNFSPSASRNEKVAIFKINGVAQPVGVYNSTNLPAIITGTGQLQVLVGDVQITSVAHTVGHFLVTGLTAPNVTVTVHASNDLVSFDNGVPVTADTSGVFNYDDATGLTKRFYKVSYP